MFVFQTYAGEFARRLIMYGSVVSSCLHLLHSFVVFTFSTHNNEKRDKDDNFL